jgi:hypothetical protein
VDVVSKGSRHATFLALLSLQCLHPCGSCNANCRAACNYHGTMCDSSSVIDSPGNTSDPRVTIKAVVSQGTCTCDPG